MCAEAAKPPSLETQIESWLREYFSLTGKLSQLPGERDLNFLLHTADGDALVCKFCHDPAETERLAAQHEVLALLHEKKLAATPRVVTSTAGPSLIPFEHDSQVWLGRTLTYVPGQLLSKCTPYRPALLRDLGHTVGRLDRALLDFTHPAFDYHFDWDLAHATEVVERYRELITDGSLRDQVDRIHSMFSEQVCPRLNQLRKSVIHNDANDYNVLVDGDRVSGLIDFGDMVHTYTVCDPAIAMAYATLGSSDPIEVVREVARGYHESLPFEEAELAVLFPMLCMRLAVSACMAAHQMRLRPDDPYLVISQEPIRNTLPRLLEQDSGEIHQMLKEEVGS